MVGWWSAPARPSSSRRSRPRTRASICDRSSPKADRMRMQDGRGGMGRRGWMGWRGRKGSNGPALVVFVLCFLPARPASPAYPASPAHPALPAYPGQVTFEQAAKDLSSSDPGTRVKAAQMLKEAGYPEAAVPLAALITDPADEVQLEAIAAELNIFLAERIVPRKRIGFVIEVRNQVVAESAFSSGPLAAGPRPVPGEVLTALRTAKSAALRGIAAEGLARLGDASQLAPIQAALGNERSDSLALTSAFAAAMLSGAPLSPIAEALTRPKLHDQAQQYLVE